MKRNFSAYSTISTIESSRSSDRWLLRILLAAVVVGLIWFLLSLNSTVSEQDIRAGGSLEEGVVGTPRFVNPVLALTRADQDVSALVYSSLLTINEQGELVPSIAQDWAISEDGTVYTINLRQDVQFHDDIPLTTTDVAFTIGLIQNNDLKSPLRGNWNGVSVTVIDDYTIELVLEEPYAPFIENLTVGIMPAHIWREIPIEQVPFSSFNTTPIGSGPYQINDTTFSDNGTVAEYILGIHDTYTPQPLLSEITISFFSDEDDLALAWGDTITSSAYLRPEFVTSEVNREDYSVTEVPLDRTFALFFNQNRSDTLREDAVREALELALDRQNIIDTALSGAGIPSLTAVNNADNALELEEFHANSGNSNEPTGRELATMVLEDAGWNQTDQGSWEKDVDGDLIPLELTVRTVNSPLFESTAAVITESWKELGIIVVTEQFTQSDLVQSVIRERDFEILLFGIDAGRTQDIYPFWHSSQQNDPGLNIAQYTNLTVDESLEIARTTNDAQERAAALATVNTVIQEERPAIFLFQPTVQYVTPLAVEISLASSLGQPADRFSTIQSWYAEQRMLWPFFREETNEEILHTDEQNNN